MQKLLPQEHKTGFDYTIDSDDHEGISIDQQNPYGEQYVWLTLHQAELLRDFIDAVLKGEQS